MRALLLTTLASVACQTPHSAPSHRTRDVTPPAPATSLRDADLDGDRVPDPIETRFTGGAHCCYTLDVHLSSGTIVSLPFQIDGGYVFGLDLSQPGHFNIADFDGDGVLDVCAEIATYNGEPSPIPAAWTRAFGIRKNHVVVSFVRGTRARDRERASCVL